MTTKFSETKSRSIRVKKLKAHWIIFDKSFGILDNFSGITGEETPFVVLFTFTFFTFTSKAVGS